MRPLDLAEGERTGGEGIFGEGGGCEGERRADTVRQKGVITAKNTKHRVEWKKRTFRG